MRVCLVYDCLFPYTVGGAERWYRNLAERLVEAGHEVTYLTLTQWDDGVRPDLIGVDVVSVGPRMGLYTETGRRRIGPPVRFGAGVLGHLVRHGRRYDVVHTCSFPYFSLLAASVARRPGGYRVVVDWFEVWSRDYWREYLGRVGGLVGEGVQAVCARLPQHAFCFSELQAKRLPGSPEILRGLYRAEGAGTASATDAGADALERAAEGRPSGGETGAGARPGPVVLFAARQIPEKRPVALVGAIARAAGEVPGLRGVMLGDGPEHAAVVAEIARTGAPVEAPGFVGRGRVVEELGRAMCMALPSIREGYGMIVIEAAAHGVPSIVVRSPDNAAVELVEDGVNGFVCELDGLAGAIVAVHEGGEGLRARTRAWYAEHAGELSIDASLDRVLASYSRVSTGRRGL
ncbi:MAG TPA: glycosyltransferase family 4 protein [Solirubrobacteraceae bacterium]|jgi:glycosyltransferase involved in cell wall biosynthesis|nr:glycosyltransferase family 4 protein [Solirubrobacteraceae bacterium]